MFGPTIPEHLLKKKQEEKKGEKLPNETATGDDAPDAVTEDIDAYAPELPPDMIEAYAPELPPDMVQSKTAPDTTREKGRKRRSAPLGPSFPSGPARDDEDDGVIGPILPSGGVAIEPDEDVSSTIQEIEDRARRAKEAAEEKANEGKGGKVQRGDWMLVPPEVQFLKGVDTGKSRQFSSKEVKTKVNNSVWTDTPAEKQRKLEERLSGKKRSREQDDEEPEPVRMSQRDLEMQRQVQEYNSEKRPMSLMEMHRKKYVKSKSFDKEDASKRPFDREKDLKGGSSRMDYKRKSEMLKRASELGTKFGSSGGSSYL
ncbi:hypothetical protein INT43_007299 [Umbelopsis isabellina]|uniref:DUF3752 domain-containing protein n=1 Tax=Mortierella isabellina TaxID=91625 RepID=A0A8H7PXD1_MORIS|nr:hypothetical protein INT43_007299 [Umbelopsis isabellina]